MNHLLIISYPFPPNASAGAVRSERFARYLAKLGWKIDVVTIKPRFDLFEDKDRLNNFGENVTIHFTTTFDPWLWLRDKRPENLMVRAIRSVLMRLFSFPDHMLLWMPFALKKALSVYKINRFDAIYTTSPPHSTHLIGLLLSKLTGKPWVADFRDPWTLNAYRGKGKIENILLWIEKKLEKAVLKNSSLLLANTKANRSNLLKAFPEILKEKVIHLPNSWEKFSITKMDVKTSNDVPFTIVHAGNFYPRFKPYALLYALSAWRNDVRYDSTVLPSAKNIKVILIGAKDAALKDIINDLGIADIVKISPWAALEKAREIMMKADMLWATLGTGKDSSTYVPSKLFEYIAAKKPILGFFPKGEAASLIHKTGTGTVFTEDNPEPIINFLKQAILSKGNQQIELFAPNYDIINKYNIESIAYKFSKLLKEIIE